MRKLVASIPLPFAGVMLGFATLGNVFQAALPNTPVLRTVCGAVATVIAILLVLKWLLAPKACLEDLKNPVVASTFPTFDMGLMVLMTYLNPFAPSAAKGIWLIAIILHFILLGYVIGKFLLPFSVEKILPSHFIPFVGFVVASVTAPAFKMILAGQMLFYLGLVLYLILLVLVLYRMVKFPIGMPPLKPLQVILAAPGSLCLAGYLSSFQGEVQSWLANSLGILAAVMTILGLYFFAVSVKKDFFPTYAAYTFPFVISALGMFRFTMFSKMSGMSYAPLLKTVAYIELGIAALMCLYVLLRYVQFITSKLSAKPVVAS